VIFHSGYSFIGLAFPASAFQLKTAFPNASTSSSNNGGAAYHRGEKWADSAQ
jgi:hypothetical protein